jgi:hypothetical protein
MRTRDMNTWNTRAEVFLSDALPWNLDRLHTTPETVLLDWSVTHNWGQHPKPEHDADTRAWANQIWISEHPNTMNGRLVSVTITNPLPLLRRARQQATDIDRAAQQVLNTWSDERLIDLYGISRIKWEQESWFIAGTVYPPEEELL